MVQKAYDMAKERYLAVGVDTDKALDELQRLSISIHCWQADDVTGFEALENLGGGGIQATGNYPGRARNVDEVRQDIDKVLTLVAGRHRLSLHAIYGEFGGKAVDRDEIEPAHFTGWMQWAKERGLKLDFLYFHAYPYTSDEALEKVKKLASIVAPYTSGARLFVLPFTDAQLEIKRKSHVDETTLMFRAAMMESAEKLSKRIGAKAIVTGESLSQVASQTLDAMVFTDSETEMLVLRPLLTYDKEEIITISKRIGTYETSILPYEDCCVIFSPKHPLTHPVKSIMKEHYNALSLSSEIDKAMENMMVFYYDEWGKEVDK